LSDMDALSPPCVPVSWGELIDKITILEIKRERIARPDARANVLKELAALDAVAASALATPGIDPLLARLRRINETLWDVEDAIREQEAEARFDTGFVALARSVYKTNDERAAVKRAINALLHSDLTEEKSYAGAQAVLPTAAAHAPALIAEPAG
jgi:hypothetical protein